MEEEPRHSEAASRIEKNHDWLGKNASKERTRYYTELFAKSQRVDINKSLKLGINHPPQKINEGDTLYAYLQEVFDNQQSLSLSSLSGLQLQGYQVDFLPSGYQIEIKDGKLSIYKNENGTRKFYRSPETEKEVKGLDLLAALPTKSDIQFRSGSHRASLKAARSKREARLMVRKATKEGTYTKITGSVNGVKIRDRVKIKARHVLAAKEMLHLIDNTEGLFDEQTLSWINEKSNLQLLRALAERNWSIIAKMNEKGTEEFKRTRATDGVIQLTLVWRRIRSVLPKTLIQKIREGSLDLNELESINMSLVQTDSIRGQKARADRSVAVESVVPLSSSSRRRTKKRPIKRPKQASEPAEVLESKDPENIPEKEWKRQSAMLKFFFREYPELNTNIINKSETERIIEITYNGKFATKDVTIKRNVQVSLPTKKGDKMLISMNGLENPKNWSAVARHMSEIVKQKIERDARAELEQILNSAMASIIENKNLDVVIAKIRNSYTKGSLKLDALLGLNTQIQTSSFNGGLLGSSPLKLMVRKSGNEVGLELSGGSLSSTIFYSLESEKRHEVEAKTKTD